MSEARTIVTKVPNGKLYSDGTILVEGVRASYPHLFKAYAGDDGGDPSFAIVGLLPKKTHKAVKDLLKAEIDKLIKANKLKDLAADRKFLKDGDQAGKESYEGMFTISAREKRRPIVKDRQKRNVDSAQADMFYGGCWVNILIRPWFQKNSFGTRVNANLIAVQFVRDDEPFGEGRIGEEEVDDSFDALDEEDGDESGGFDDDDNGGL